MQTTLMPAHLLHLMLRGGDELDAACFDPSVLCNTTALSSSIDFCLLVLACNLRAGPD